MRRGKTAVVTVAVAAATVLVMMLAAAGGAAKQRRADRAGAPPAIAQHAYRASEAPGAVGEIRDLTLRDAARGKDLRVRVQYPKQGVGPFPVIVFSHGAWGSKDNYTPLTRHWAQHGYVTIQPTHRDSLQEGTRPLDPSAFQHWQDRTKDIVFLLDSLKMLPEKAPELRGKLDTARIGVGGHSFGAGTSQLIAGATAAPRVGGKPQSFADPRPRAFVLLSPQGVGGILSAESWKPCARPMLVMSGTEDATRGGESAESRQAPYKLSPPGDKYLVWVTGLDHGFGGISGTRLHPKNATHLEATKAATLAFWDAYVKGDPAAKRYLVSDSLPLLAGNSLTVSRK